MKVYHKEISQCKDCPQCYVCIAFERCKQMDRTIDDINTLPDWCPLADVDRASQIKRMIDHRLKAKQEPYKVIFAFTVPKVDEQERACNNATLKKVRDIFSKYSVDMKFVDTMPGSFNLNRDWLEADSDVECYVEFCGVYPIHWDMDDVAELERMDYAGEVFTHVTWHVGDEYIPNN